MSTRRAERAFEAFTGRKPKAVKRKRLAERDVAGWEMGPVVGIAYEAVRDGQRAQYFHEFAKKARPNLVARDDGGQLYITDGNYTVTERGIEDVVPELFVVNPSPRRAAASKGKSKTMAAKRNRKGQFVRGGARKSTARRSFKSNPAPRKRKRAARRTTRQVAVFRANPVRGRRRRTFRRNPIGGMGGLAKLAVPAVGVGAGAVGSEIIMGYLPIPAAWKTGVMRHITKGGVGIAAGMLVAKIFRQKKLGFYISAGAIAIATHDAIKEFIASSLPMLPTSGFGQYVTPLPSQFGGMGYINPAATTAFGQYVTPLPSQFAGMSQAYDAPGGETDFRA
jgi:hypothetical protein